jgi:hypothetical protein
MAAWEAVFPAPLECFRLRSNAPARLVGVTGRRGKVGFPFFAGWTGHLFSGSQKRRQQFSSIFISDNRDAASESERKGAKGRKAAKNFLKERVYNQRAGASRRKRKQYI